MRMKITILGEPLGKKRVRATIRGGHAAVYTPSSQIEWEQMVAQMARTEMENMGVELPLHGPLMLQVKAIRKRPQRLMRKKDPVLLLWREDKPDADNVLKGVADGLEKGGLFEKSDAQIAYTSCYSLWAEKSGHARTEVILEHLTWEPT